MKYSSVFALTLCGALAFALVGCKYDDPENAGLANPNDVVTAPVDDGLNAGSGADVATDPNAMNAAAVDPNAIDPNADTASLAQATDIPIDQDPNYERCTDVDFAPVYFGFDASALAPSEMAKIEAVAQHLAQNPDRAVIVEGNCDERGSNEYNLSLGEQRALSLRTALINLGISADRIQSRSFGEEKPAVLGSGEAVWAQNRRGEFAFYK